MKLVWIGTRWVNLDRVLFVDHCTDAAENIIDGYFLTFDNGAKEIVAGDAAAALKVYLDSPKRQLARSLDLDE